MGDTVRIVEARPMSKLKRWQLKDVIRRAIQLGEAQASAQAQAQS